MCQEIENPQDRDGCPPCSAALQGGACCLHSTTARAHDDHVLREAVLKGWKLHTQSPKASPRKAPREAELALGSCAAAGAKPVGTVALSKVSDRPKQAADAPRGVSTPRSQAKPKHVKPS